jgi:hypothetical protein
MGRLHAAHHALNVRMKPVRLALFLCAALMLCSAHVGSPDVWFEGPAGPYSVRVLIRPPTVVPGLADIVVDVTGARTVFVTAASGASDAGGAPPPDEAKPRAGHPGSYTAQLWLMARGAYRVVVRVEGERGTGTAMVPVNATATERKPMSPVLGAVLVFGLLFLVAGLISIVGSAVRESLLPPGDRATSLNVRRARIGMATALVITSAVLLIGWRWWGSVDRRHRGRLDHPWTANATVDTSLPGAPLLRFAITDSAWRMRKDTSYLRRVAFSVAPQLVPDHGKIMHLFLVHEDGLRALAHLHPTSGDDENFRASLPPLPSGRYRVFADIVEASGATRTIASSFDVPSVTRDSASPFSPSDADDAVWIMTAGTDVNAKEQRITPDLTFRWDGPSAFTADEPAELRGSILTSAGAPVRLEPYMGMAGHAVVTNADGSVYVHLHPMGTISMAALKQVTAATAMQMPVEASRLVFPYAFPRAGRYRVWIQFRVDGRIITAAHDVEVAAR